MYGRGALSRSQLQSIKSRRLLARSRVVLDEFRSKLTRSESNLARSYAMLLKHKPPEPGRIFRRAPPRPPS